MTNTNKVSQKNGDRKRNSKRRYYTYKKDTEEIGSSASAGEGESSYFFSWRN